MATTRITISEQFDLISKFLKEHGASKQMIDFIADRKALHVKKIGTRKLTKTQEANIGLIEDITDYMSTVDKPITISEIIKSVSSCSELSTPKVSALVTKMKNAGNVIRTEVKGKAYFTLA